MRRALTIVALAAALAVPRAARADDQTVELGMYAPAAPFASSADARAWLEEFARAFQAASGRRVTFRVHFRYAELIKARPHIAIIDPRCVALRKPGRVVATARTARGTYERWGLWAPAGTTIASLKRARVAHDSSGCGDRDFLAHTILADDLALSHFGPLIAAKTPPLAADAIGKSANAAFLPIGLGVHRKLEQLFEGDPVPGPALVIMRPLGAASERALIRMIGGFKSTRDLRGFSRGNGSRYRTLAARMKKRRKQPVLAEPARYRLPPTGLVEVGGAPADRPGLGHLIR